MRRLPILLAALLAFPAHAITPNQRGVLLRPRSGSFAPAFVLTNMAPYTPPGAYIKNVNTFAWDAKVMAGPYTGDMSFTYLATNTGTDAWVGFASNPSALSNTQGVEAIYYSSNAHTFAYTGASAGTDYGAYTSSTVQKFRRVGAQVIWSSGGVDLQTWSQSAATPLYFIMAEAVFNGVLTLVSAKKP